MEQTEMFKPEDTRLSYSSATLLQNCETRYYNYKIKKSEVDSDAAKRDNSHFHIGTSFHYILEMSMHKKPNKIGELLEYCVQNFGLREEDTALVHAMVIQYLRLRKDSGFEAVACEYAIEHESIIGFVDLIERQKDGSFYISDLKTASSFYDSKISELAANQQLNLYCSFYKEIAKKYNLDPDKFMGARYLVAVKSKAKQRANESYNDFVMRLVDKKLVKCVFVTIPKELMRIDAAREEHMSLYNRSLEIRAGGNPTKNLTYCNAFFKSCEYFSKCHGMEHSEFLKLNSIVVERT